MRTIVLTGTLDAQTSIVHGARPSGNAHPFRRETFILPTGKRLTGVPVISGGVVRGSLRRTAASMTHHTLAGDGTLPHSVVNALRSGGSLRESRRNPDVLSGERQAIIRDAIPMLALFGLAAGGRIMSGRLQVGKPLPVAQETRYLAKHYDVDLSGYDPPSIWQVVQRETYTRVADLGDARTAAMVDQATEPPEPVTGMIYNVESISAGTRLFHQIVLDNATPAEVSFFDDLMQHWSQRATIGGSIAKGMGRVAPHYTRTVYDLSGNPADPEPPVDWRAHMADRSDQITQLLEWL